MGTLALNPQPLVSPTAETRPGETVTTPGGTPPLADAAGARVVLRFDLDL